jgi:hypothetical protein
LANLAINQPTFSRFASCSNEILTIAELKLRIVQCAYDSLNADKTADKNDTQKSKLLMDFLNTLDNEDF